MTVDFVTFRRDVIFFLSSLRYSIDRPVRRSSENQTGDQRFMNALLAIEEARIRFNMYTRFRETPSTEELRLAKEALIYFREKFLQINVEKSVFAPVRFFPGPFGSRDRENPSAFVSQFILDKETVFGINEAVLIFDKYVDSVNVNTGAEQKSLKFADLGKIVPLQQQIAPAQFEVKNGRVSVIKRPPYAEEGDRSNICSALMHLKDSGERLISNLENSNCDRRLLESVKELQLQLSRDDNIIKIGLTNIACGMMGAQFQSEMPGAIAAMLNSHTTGVSLYVSQFPDWDRFANKAAMISLDENDVAEVDAAANSVISALERDTEIADPDVPQTIRIVREFLSVPGATAKKATFAMIRTLENLVASILKYSVEFVNKTAELVVETGAKAASRAVVALLGIALMGASGIGSAAVHAGSPWVKQAVEIVFKQIEKMAK